MTKRHPVNDEGLSTDPAAIRVRRMRFRRSLGIKCMVNVAVTSKTIKRLVESGILEPDVKHSKSEIAIAIQYAITMRLR